MPRSLRTRQCSHSARPSAVCTPRPWTKSCSANSPSCLELGHQLGDLVADGDGLERDDVELAAVLRAVEVGQAEAVALGLARAREALEHGLAVLGVEHDDVVALGVAGEVAEQRARVQVVGLGPHALQARAEVVLEQLAPLLALHAAPAPVQLEQHVRVEVGVELVAVDLDLAHAPERRLGDRDVGARRASGRCRRWCRAPPPPRRPRAGCARGLADLLDELARAARARSGGPSRPGPRRRPCSRRRPGRTGRRTPCRPGRARAARTCG